MIVSITQRPGRAVRSPQGRLPETEKEVRGGEGTGLPRHGLSEYSTLSSGRHTPGITFEEAQIEWPDKGPGLHPSFSKAPDRRK